MWECSLCGGNTEALHRHFHQQPAEKHSCERSLQPHSNSAIIIPDHNPQQLELLLMMSNTLRVFIKCIRPLLDTQLLNVWPAPRSTEDLIRSTRRRNGPVREFTGEPCSRVVPPQLSSRAAVNAWEGRTRCGSLLWFYLTPSATVNPNPGNFWGWLTAPVMINTRHRELSGTVKICGHEWLALVYLPRHNN